MAKTGEPGKDPAETPDEAVLKPEGAQEQPPRAPVPIAPAVDPVAPVAAEESKAPVAEPPAPAPAAPVPAPPAAPVVPPTPAPTPPVVSIQPEPVKVPPAVATPPPAPAAPVAVEAVPAPTAPVAPAPPKAPEPEVPESVNSPESAMAIFEAALEEAKDLQKAQKAKARRKKKGGVKLSASEKGIQVRRHIHRSRRLIRGESFVALRRIKLGDGVVLDPGERVGELIHPRRIRLLARRGMVGVEGDPWVDQELARIGRMYRIDTPKIRDYSGGTTSHEEEAQELESKLQAAGFSNVEKGAVAAEKGELQLVSRGAGWFSILDAESNETQRIRGKKAALSWLTND